MITSEISQKQRKEEDGIDREKNTEKITKRTKTCVKGVNRLSESVDEQ